ncbi:MAG: ATP-binding protein [Candidatus Binatia bacterium]|nr:ATP-binding protein [Candidatus Binatia bacterium]MDG2010576.1 ATP-binding protein [Candidatus Binatia bacterium]
MATSSQIKPVDSASGDRSNRWIDVVLDATSEAILVINEAGEISQFNRCFVEMWGILPAALEQGSALDICDRMVQLLPDPLAARDQFLSLLAQSETPPPAEIEFPDGRIIEYRWSPRIDGGLISGGVLLFRDITEVRQARLLLSDEVWVNAGLAKIRRQLAWSSDTSVMLHRLCEATTEILECDASHTYLWSPEESSFLIVAGDGDSAEQWRHLQTAEPLRESFGEILEAFDRDEIVEVRSEAGGAVRSIERQPINLPERTLFMALRRGEEIIGFHSACLRDAEKGFDEQQRRLARGTAQLCSLALENARLVQELGRANRRKEEFVSALSHALRSPLHVILGYTELLLEEERDLTSTDPRDLIRRIDRSGRQLAEMLEGSLAAGIDPKVGDVSLGKVVLSDLLREVEIETREIRQEAGLSYAWDIAPNLPALQSDADKIKLIIKNLISNAVKFTDEGGIFLRATARDTGVEIAVEDTGIGIGKEAQKIIFEPFRQIDRTEGRVLRGTGLGLHVVRQLVDLLGGTLAVESAPGEGAIFRVWLPAPGIVAS